MIDSQTAPVLSIIIVTWNAKRYALECLASLAWNCLKVPTEIIVVDNASTDGTPAAIRAQFPDVCLIENKANLGFAKANNIGMSRSRGKYLSLINSDVVVAPECLSRMLALMDADDTIGVAGPKMLCADGSVGNSAMRYPTVWNTLCAALALNSIFPRSQVFHSYSVESAELQGAQEVQVLGGWFLMISRAALEQVGGLDERFFMFGEDIDWCRRFGQAGWRVVFCADAHSLHYGGGSSIEAPARTYVEMRRSNLLYFKKHHGYLGALGYTLVIGVHEIARIAGYSFSYCYNRSRRFEAGAKVRRSLSSLRWLLGAASWMTETDR